MKKSLILISTLLASTLVIAGCGKNKNSENNNNNNNNNSQQQQVNALATPVVTINQETGMASWAPVANAKGYIYKLNGAEKATLKTSIQLSNGDTLQVKATGDGKTYSNSEYSEAVTYLQAGSAGLPVPESGYYMVDADVIQDGNTRYLVYTTNKSKAQEDNVIAIKKGELTDDGWVYGAQSIAIEGSSDGWDQFIGSASVAKGNFVLGEDTYNWVMAYAATTNEEGSACSIGLAVAKDIQGEWVKIENPIIEYNSEVYGANMAGYYAPSVVNYNKASGIRVFYTYADAYGHFAHFYDADLSDLSNIDGVSAMITNKGDIQGGDAVTMFPNADFAYDAVNATFYAVKDYSPSAATKPNLADQFELLHIAEEELYTTEDGDGWVSDFYVDYIDLDNGYERAYSACIVSDAYGHKLETTEIIYNVCQTGENYLHTQKLMSYIEE